MKIKNICKKIIITILIYYFYIFVLNFNSPIKTTDDVLQNHIKTNEDNEWIMLNSNAYLKCNALFYFVNKKMIRLFVLSKTNFSITGLNGTIFMKTNDMEEKSIYFEKYLIQKYDKNEYNLDFEINSIDINFKYDNLISLKIKLNGIKELLNIKIKDINKSNKKNAMICSKQWELSNNAYKTLKFLFEFNRMIGFDKIVIYNNSIENNDNFNNLFKKYNKLIEIYNIKYYPLLKTNLTSKLDDIPRWCLENLFITECYLNNIDLYENVFVIDIDEILIPRRFKSTYPIDFKKGFNKFSTIDYPIQKTDLNNYIDSLKETFKINSQSLHFKMGFYLNDKLIKLIFSKFEMFLISNSKLDFTNQTYEIIVNKTDFIFTVATNQQYEYLKYILDQYKTIYEPFFEKNFDFIEKHMPESYSRFYFLSGSFVYRYFGKTFHNVQSNPSYLSCHHPKDGDFLEMDTKYAHVSHFRNSYENYFINSFYQDINISIDQLFFDYNFFYSYFQIIKDSWLNL